MKHASVAEAAFDSPVGRLMLVAGPNGLRRIVWPGERERGDRETEPRRANASGRLSPEVCLAAAAAQLGEYFAGTRRVFDLPLDPVGTPFQHAVWEVLRAIPFGATISYGEQARRLGDVKKARAVGAANGRNPLPIVVPCHRVIGADGTLVGFAAGTGAKAWLLRHEGVAPPGPSVRLSKGLPGG